MKRMKNEFSVRTQLDFRRQRLRRRVRCQREAGGRNVGDGFPVRIDCHHTPPAIRAGGRGKRRQIQRQPGANHAIGGKKNFCELGVGRDFYPVGGARGASRGTPLKLSGTHAQPLAIARMMSKSRRRRRLNDPQPGAITRARRPGTGKIDEAHDAPIIRR